MSGLVTHSSLFNFFPALPLPILTLPVSGSVRECQSLEGLMQQCFGEKMSPATCGGPSPRRGVCLQVSPPKACLPSSVGHRGDTTFPFNIWRLGRGKAKGMRGAQLRTQQLGNHPAAPRLPVGCLLLPKEGHSGASSPATPLLTAPGLCPPRCNTSRT